MPRTALALWAVVGLTASSQAAPQSTAQEIASAVLPLPEQLRDASAVVRLNRAGFAESLRAGTNGMVCIADRPGDDQFDVRCYREDFIPVVYRAFQLNAEGVHGLEATNRIEVEIKSGKLSLPTRPTAGYRCLGPVSGYNAATNSVANEIRCWQSIHFPFRTAHEMGLMDESEIPAGMRSKMPYVMSSGRYWCHVMIEHPQNAADAEHLH
jgi:hypothetical protein